MIFFYMVSTTPLDFFTIEYGKTQVELWENKAKWKKHVFTQYLAIHVSYVRELVSIQSSLEREVGRK